MFHFRQKAIKFATPVFMGLFLLAVSFIPAMGMHDSSMSGNCPYIDIMDGATGCTMTPLQHVAAAQNMFSVLPQDKNTLSTLILLLLALVIVSFLKNFFSPPRVLTPVSFATSRFLPPRSSLQEAFSRGILNPKTF